MRRMICAAREWWMPIASASLFLGIVVLYVLLLPALGEISAQVKAGNQAKARQCVNLPSNTKMVLDAHSRGVLNMADVQRLTKAPQDCGRVMPGR